MGLLGVTAELIIFGHANVLSVYNIKTGLLVDEYSSVKEASIDLVQVSVKHGMLAVAFSNKTLLLWKMNDCAKLFTVCNTTTKKRVCSVAFCDKNNTTQVLVADKSGDLYEYLSDGENPGELILGHVSMLLDVKVSHDSKYIVTADRDEKIRVSLLNRPCEIENFCLGHKEFVYAVAVLQNHSHLLLSTSGDGAMRLWNIQTGYEICSFEFDDSDAKHNLNNTKYFASILKYCPVQSLVCIASELKEYSTEIKLFTLANRGCDGIEPLNSIYIPDASFIIDCEFGVAVEHSTLFVLYCDKKNSTKIRKYEITESSFKQIDDEGVIEIGNKIGSFVYKSNEDYLKSLFKATLTGKAYADYVIKKEKRIADKNGSTDVEIKRTKIETST